MINYSSTFPGIPAPDSPNNALMSEVIGNKTDAAFGSPGLVYSIVAYVKGVFYYFTSPPVDSVQTGYMMRVAGNKGDTPKTAADIDNTSSLMSYAKGGLLQNHARGTTKRGAWTKNCNDYETGLDIASGKGKLLYGYFEITTGDATQLFMRITMDGTAYELPFAGILTDVEYALAYQDRAVVNLFCHDANLSADVRMLNYEFKTSLKVELRRPNQAGGVVDMTLFYIED